MSKPLAASFLAVAGRRGPAAARATPEVRPGCRRHTEVAAKNCCARGLDKC